MIPIKIIGILLVVIGLFLSYIIYSYTQNILERNRLLHEGCPLPENVCPYKQILPVESIFGFIISGVLVVIGLYLIFSQQKIEKLSLREKSKLTKNIKSLDREEKTIYKLLENSDGTMFQSDMITRTGFSKVKVSRILDKLEAKGIVERRRRGMANVIMLKV